MGIPRVTAPSGVLAFCGVAAALVVGVIAATGAAAETSTSTPTASTNVSSVSSESLAADPVLVGAGDIGVCGSDNDEATANLIDNIPGTVFTAGDNAYPDGSADDFTECYDPGWGRHKARTYPAPGNHDYYTSGASGYFGYFGARASDSSKGYYSYNVGDNWHVLVVNSNCSKVSCAKDSAQEKWVRSDLAANTKSCVAAVWHHPRWTSGDGHGNATEMGPIVQALHDYDADVLLTGHNHVYERLPSRTPAARRTPRAVSASSSSARAARTCTAGTRSSPTAKPATPTPTACSS